MTISVKKPPSSRKRRDRPLVAALVYDGLCHNEAASDFTIAQWSEVAAMSERTFLRRFRETTGMTPREYIAAARLDRARELLETSALSIDIVAFECGFGGGATLRHHFRAKLGITPTAYRNRFGQSRNAANS